MSEITRRGFLQGSGKAAVSLGLGSAVVGMGAHAGFAANGQPPDDKADGGAALGKALRLPMEVKYVSNWLSWVASTTGCLRALGVDCDPVDVAGHSGYAFITNIHHKVDPSSVDAFDLSVLLPGVRRLGRSTLMFRGAHWPGELDDAKDENHRKCIREEMRAVYDFVSREIQAGRPCVIFGTYVPEFGIATGVEDDKYLVESVRAAGDGRLPQTPIPFDGLACLGGSYALAFPSAVHTVRPQADRDAVLHALDMLSYPRSNPGYSTGQAAYDAWIAALERGEAEAFGNSFSAQCWATAKRFARDFVQRLAKRNGRVAAHLDKAAAAYVDVAAAMNEVAVLFPYPGAEQHVNDPEFRSQAIEPLRTAKAAEARAAEALAQAWANWPEDR